MKRTKEILENWKNSIKSSKAPKLWIYKNNKPVFQK